MNSLALSGLASRLRSFEQLLLLEIAVAGDEAYCAELTERIRKERRTSEGQVSRTLGVLKGLGLIEGEPRFPKTPQIHMRRRIVFSLTEVGKAAVTALERNSRSAASLKEAALFA